MPLDDRTRRAVLDAARRISEGDPPGMGSRDFWGQHGITRRADRQDVLARAAALAEGAAAANPGVTEGTIEDLFSGTGYPVAGVEGGPADTSRAHVFIRISFDTPSGGVAYRSFATELPWDAELDELYAEIADAIEEYEGFYGISGGSPMYETILVY